MAIFSDKIVDVVYANPEYTLIKIRYEDPEGNICPHVIDVDPNNSDFQALEAEGWDSEKIIVQTAEWKRAQSEAWNIEVNAAAQEIAKEMLGLPALQNEMKQTESKLISLDKEVKVKTGKVDNAMYDFIRDSNESKEELFKFKLWALEQDVVKEADKSVKSSIRKATRITSAMAIYDSLI